MKATNKTKRQPTEWGKMSVNESIDTGLIFEVYKQFMQLYVKKNDPVKKWAEDLSGQFSKEDMQVTQKHMKRCLTLLIIREMQIKTIVTYNLARVRISVKSLSQVWLFVTPWTAAFQAPLSMGFSRQEYWSGLPSLSPGDLPNPGKIIRKSTDNQCWRGSGEKGTILYCWWECKLVKTTGENSIEVP